MKLYTLNATPLRSGDDMQTVTEKMLEYKGVVARTLSAWGIDGFTIYEVAGYWQGEAERSFKIEIAIDKDEEVVYNVAMKLKSLYNQDSVMVTLPDNTVKFV